MFIDTTFLVLMALSSTLLGKWIIRCVVAKKMQPVELLALAMPLGLGVTGSIQGILSTNGFFHYGIIINSLIGSFLIIVELMKSNNYSGVNWHAIYQRISLPTFVFLILVFTTWLGIHSPVIDGDALCYHLEVAKRMAGQDGLIFDPDLHETVYPLIVESLQSMALHFSGPIATRSISFLFGLSLACATVILARPFVGFDKSYWAGSLLLTLPIVNAGMISPLNDVPLASLCVSSLASFIFLSEVAPVQKRILISGLYCGLACGVKFPGIVWTMVMVTTIPYLIHETKNSTRIQIRFTLRCIAFFAFVVMITGGYWYLRAALVTGNPVHPYFRDTFGGRGLDEVLAEDRKAPLEKLLNITTAPLVMSLAPSRFDSFSHQVGPLLLAVIPLGLCFKMQGLWYFYLFVAWLEMAVCLSQRQSPRFFLACFAPLCAAAVAVIHENTGNYNSKKTAKINQAKFVFGLILCLTTISLNLARVRLSIMVVSGLVNKSEWLVSHEPTFWLGRWADFNLPRDARIIGQDHRGFYWSRSYSMEKAHRRRLGMNETNMNSDQMIRHMKLQGFSHLVMAEPIPQNAVEFDPTLSIILGEWLKSTQPMFDVTLRENDGFLRRYRIYELLNNNTDIKSHKYDEFIEQATLKSFTEDKK